MAISVKQANLSNSMNPFVTIQVASGSIPRFLSYECLAPNDKQFYSVTSIQSLAVKMPLVSAQAILPEVQRRWPLAQISHEVC
ncbi:hypothetical protein [Vibrio ordalii]|uniref:hypothetical protein n=1 Tax=Vibrio ordalii TaxID=28174 RepID=UPI0002FBBFEE|nr:hypothetical protein [Vibrio ordalii]OEE76392.1 hypothetical protein A1QQ_15400 [Vibrio ordalii FF-167]